jgi:hypothetical protein
MTITLQDLQVLNEKATQGEWRSMEHVPNLCQIVNDMGSIATVAIWNSGMAGQPTENRANAEFITALVNFYRSGALQRLAELAEDGLQWRRIRELADDNQRIMVEMIEKHEAARAPSVKEGKS